MYGWAGQRIKVYLTEGKIVKEPLSEEMRLNYLGGRGFNSKTLFDEVKPGIDPLGPENVVMVGVGPLNGTAVPAASRWTVTAKSTVAVPGGLGDGNGGGDFSSELKFAGYDQIVFYGRSPKPVYLWIDDGHLELKDASGIWGKTTLETNYKLWEEHGDRNIRVLCIGPAGENLVRMSKVFVNITRTGGKGGMGAVLGSKNVKAVAVRGTGSVKIARPAEFLQAVRRAHEKLMSRPAVREFAETGTLFLVRRFTNERGLTTRNSQAGYFEGWEKVSSEAFEAQYAVKHKGCAACGVSCSHYYKVKDGPYATHGESNEYGTTYPLGPKCGIDNLAAILKMTTICDHLGLDTHSTGATIAFAMECRQRGLLTAKDTDDLDLSWGNHDAVIQMLPRIAYRQGFGDLLAEGSYRASKHIPGSEVCLKVSKGQEASALFPGTGNNIVQSLAYATATRGADHLRGGMQLCGIRVPRLKEVLGGEEAVKDLVRKPRAIENKGILLAFDNDFMAMINTLEVCQVVAGRMDDRVNLDQLAELVTFATGVDMSGDDLMKVGERINNLEKAFNIREGMGRKDDTLPPSFLVEKETPYGTEGLSQEKFDTMLDEFYQFRGWDHEGIPTKKKLEELGLGDVADQIGAR
ncbi:MAG: aldehyde ferredoxin oxidoreductase family protein [Desulfobacterales bacterium]|nr:aldehyde ferredoxin oxidoreductase family protein [Desulfobacterales bacterium]